MNILLSDNADIFHRQCQAQHDQVSVSSIQAMTIVWWELMFVASDPLHNLVFTFTWTIRSSENNTEIFPIIILFDLFLNEKVDHFVEFFHELSTGWNGIVFEVLLTIASVLLIVPIKSFYKLFVVSGTLKSSCSLIVHFWSWSDTIQS